MEQKPTPSQFGLTEEAVARLAAIDSGDDSAERWAIRFIAFSPATLGLYAAGCPKGLLVFLGVIGFFVWIWAEEHLLKLLFPKLDAYRAYRDACAAHERRRAEQEHQLELKRLAYWSDLPYAQLENEVAALFRRMGHRAQVQGGSGDGGVDVAVDDDTIVQCKAYAKPLSPAAVRELLGTKTALGKKRAILVCTGGFTAGSREFARYAGIELWDAHELVRLHERRYAMSDQGKCNDESQVPAGPHGLATVVAENPLVSRGLDDLAHGRLLSPSEGITPDPNDPEYYYARATMWLRNNNVDRAIRDFDVAMSLDWNFYYRPTIGGRYWVDKHQYDMAMDEEKRNHDENIRRYPNDPRAYCGRGWFWLNRKEYGKAIMDFEEAIRRDPDPDFYRL